MSTCTSRLSRPPLLRFCPADAPLPALTHIADFLTMFRRLAEQPQIGGKLETMGTVDDKCGSYPLFAWTRRASANSWDAPPTGLQREARLIKKPRLYLSAGIHGDEPAGPLALLELLAEGFFDDRAHWFVCPVLNPLGFVSGTRENPENIDLNRDYLARRSEEVRAHIAWLERQPPFDLTLCLHEDWESTGFYLYEHNAKHRPSLAHALLDAVRPYMPIEPAELIDDRPIDEHGILRPKVNIQELPEWPEQFYLLEHAYYDLGYTMETPSSLPLAPRVAAQKALVTTAVEGVLKELKASPLLR